MFGSLSQDIPSDIMLAKRLTGLVEPHFLGSKALLAYFWIGFI
jgi:hypothetical protein